MVSKQTDICHGQSLAMQKVFQTIEKLARTEDNILIPGENGTGKIFTARQIHNLSARKNEIFVTVDLASLVESLFESALFGYIKGASADASAEKSGYLEIATKGTLFLDEIGNLSLPKQAKVLSVLQNREFTPLGSIRRKPADALRTENERLFYLNALNHTGTGLLIVHVFVKVRYSNRAIQKMMNLKHLDKLSRLNRLKLCGKLSDH